VLRLTRNLTAMLSVAAMAVFCACTPSTAVRAEPSKVDDQIPSSISHMEAETWPRTAEEAEALALRIERLTALESGRPALVHDGGIWLIALPADVDLNVVKRVPSPGNGSDGETFTDAAKRADIKDVVDVVINGMTYSLDPNLHQQGSRRDTAGSAHGRALQDGVVVGGQPLRPTTERYHLVQVSSSGGLNSSDWTMGPGDWSRGTGLTGVMAILAGGQPIGGPGGGPNADSDKLVRLTEKAGMPYVGIDRRRDLIWIVVKNWGESHNAAWTTVADIREVFTWLGVEDVVALDGGDSVCLVVDGVVLVRPSPYKDRSIPFGLRFSWKAVGRNTAAPEVTP